MGKVLVITLILVIGTITVLLHLGDGFLYLFLGFFILSGYFSDEFTAIGAPFLAIFRNAFAVILASLASIFLMIGFSNFF